VLALAAGTALAAVGCATVVAWERGTLARPEMALDPSALQSEARGHVYESREGASGRGASEGGGCGCD
jgi:hypothetical protein